MQKVKHTNAGQAHGNVGGLKRSGRRKLIVKLGARISNRRGERARSTHASRERNLGNESVARVVADYQVIVRVVLKLVLDERSPDHPLSRFVRRDSIVRRNRS